MCQADLPSLDVLDRLGQVSLSFRFSLASGVGRRSADMGLVHGFSPEIGLGYMLFQVLGALMAVNPTSSAAGRVPGSLVAITHFPDTRGRLGLGETAQDCMRLFLNAVHPDLSPDDSGGRYNTRDIQHCQGPLTLWLRHLR